MQTATQTPQIKISDQAQNVSIRMAAKFFNMRGCNSEVHLKQRELSALLAIAYEAGSAGATM